MHNNYKLHREKNNLSYSYIGMNIFLIWFVLFALTNVASAQDYYVATSGDNSNTGLSINNAWKTPSYAAQQANAGDTIYMVNGTWYNELIVFAHSGTAGNPITLTAYNGTPTLIFKGAQSGQPNGIRAVHVNNIRINGLNVRGYYYNIQVAYIDDVIISNNSLTNSWGGGSNLMLYHGVTNFSILNNIIDNKTGGGNSFDIQGGIIGSGDEIYNGLIYNNTVSNTIGHSALNFGAAYNSVQQKVIWNISVLNNNIYNCYINSRCVAVNAITLYDINFSGNIVHDGLSGVSMSITNGTINDNIVYNFQGAPLGEVDTNSYSTNVTYSNNSVYNNSVSGFRILTGTQLSVINSTVYNNTVADFDARGAGTVVNITDTKTNTYTIFTNNANIVIIKYTDNSIFSQNGANTTYYYPGRSEYITKGNEIVTITKYPMTVRPTTSPATVTVNSFNTALPAGSVLASFTANTINNNNVAFTMSTLTPGKRYFVKVGGATVDTPIADTTGMIQFSRSNWPAGVFTVVEDASYVPSQSRGNAIGKSIYVNKTALPAANVTLYYNNGTSYGQTILSGSDGSFEFKNVPAGSYYVIINKQLFEKNQSSMFIISANMTTNIGSRSLEFLDVNGDKKIDVLDLSKIYENLPGDGQIYDPVCDVNGDGHVNILDASQVTKNI